MTQQFQPVPKLLDTVIPWYSSMSDYRVQDLGLQIHLGAWDHGNVLRWWQERTEEKGGAGSIRSISTTAFPSRAGVLPKAWWLFSAVGNSLLTREFTVEGNKEKGVVKWNNEMLFSSTVLKPSCKLIYSVRNKQARYFQGILTRFWLKTRNMQEIRVRILLKQGQETHGKGSSADSSMHNLFPGFCTIFVHKLFMNRLQILKQTNEETFTNYGIIDMQYVVS